MEIGGGGGGGGGVGYGWRSFNGPMRSGMGKGSSYVYGITMIYSLSLKPVARII